MSIKKERDPRTKKEILIAEGEVRGIHVYALKEVKTYSNNGRAWTPTHRLSVNINGDFIFLGLTDKESEINTNTFNVKDADDNWQEVNVGDTVSAVVEESGEYNGKKQYSSKKSNIVFLTRGNGPRSNSKGHGSEGSSPKGSFSSKPIEAGNARSCAANWVSRGNAKMDKFIDVSKDFVIVADKLRREFSEKMPSFEAGVSVGQGCLAASLIVKSLEDVEEFVRNYVSTLIPKSLELIDDVAKADVAKAETKDSTKKEEKKESPKIDSGVDDPFDVDDIPF